MPKEAAAARTARAAELAAAGVPEELARRFASLPLLTAATDIVLVADRTEQAGRRSDRDLFRGGGFLPARPHRLGAQARSRRRIISIASRSIARSIPSATPSGGITAAMVATGVSGEAAVEAWVKPAPREIERIRAAVHEIAGSGLTMSKLRWRRACWASGER